MRCFAQKIVILAEPGSDLSHVSPGNKSHLISNFTISIPFYIYTILENNISILYLQCYFLNTTAVKGERKPNLIVLC